MKSKTQKREEAACRAGLRADLGDYNQARKLIMTGHEHCREVKRLLRKLSPDEITQLAGQVKKSISF